MELLVKNSPLTPKPMNLFFDSVEDYAFNLQCPIVDAELLKSTLKHYSSMDGDDVYDYLSEAGDTPSDSMDEQEDEYREDRYEQMASRHHC